MEDLEEVLSELTRFEAGRQQEIPHLLEDFLKHVARTGDSVFPWPKVRPLLKRKLDLIADQFCQHSPPEKIPPMPNVDPFKYDQLREEIHFRIDSLSGTPFTIQRLCELVTEPQRFYKRTDKFMRGVEKNVLVVTTIEATRPRRPGAEPTVNGTAGPGHWGLLRTATGSPEDAPPSTSASADGRLSPSTSAAATADVDGQPPADASSDEAVARCWDRAPAADGAGAGASVGASPAADASGRGDTTPDDGAMATNGVEDAQDAQPPVPAPPQTSADADDETPMDVAVAGDADADAETSPPRPASPQTPEHTATPPAVPSEPPLSPSVAPPAVVGTVAEPPATTAADEPQTRAEPPPQATPTGDVIEPKCDDSADARTELPALGPATVDPEPSDSSLDDSQGAADSASDSSNMSLEHSLCGGDSSNMSLEHSLCDGDSAPASPAAEESTDDAPAT